MADFKTKVMGGNATALIWLAVGMVINGVGLNIHARNIERIMQGQALLPLPAAVTYMDAMGLPIFLLIMVCFWVAGYVVTAVLIERKK